ncbi:hypothetical protein [Phenylobacterium sp.]|uniref:hypothetical protein n=1 Tax=Phenylobacterium sp. TaxID=1871053 RepID=UPI0039835493
MTENGASLLFSFKVRQTGIFISGPCLTTTGGTSTAASWTSGSVSSSSNYSDFQTISTTLTPSWTGRLISAQPKIRTTGSGAAETQDFWVDNVSLQVLSAPSGKAIYRQVISTATNPFGVTFNSNGIYVLNLGGADLTISNSMIVGTLIIQNAGTVRVGERRATCDDAFGLPGPAQNRADEPAMSHRRIELDASPDTSLCRKREDVSALGAFSETTLSGASARDHSGDDVYPQSRRRDSWPSAHATGRGG